MVPEESIRYEGLKLDQGSHAWTRTNMLIVFDPSLHSLFISRLSEAHFLANFTCDMLPDHRSHEAWHVENLLVGMASALKCLDPIICFLLRRSSPGILLTDDIVRVVSFFNVWASASRADAEESFDALGVLTGVKLHLVTTMGLTDKEEFLRTVFKLVDHLLME